MSTLADKIAKSPVKSFANALSMDSIRNLALVVATSMLGDVWKKLDPEDQAARLDAAVEKLKALSEIQLLQNLVRENQPSLLFVKIPAKFDTPADRATLLRSLRVLYPLDTSVYKIVFVGPEWHINNLRFGDTLKGWTVTQYKFTRVKADTVDEVYPSQKEVVASYFFISEIQRDKFLEALPQEIRETTDVVETVGVIGSALTPEQCAGELVTENLRAAVVENIKQKHLVVFKLSEEG